VSRSLCTDQNLRLLSNSTPFSSHFISYLKLGLFKIPLHLIMHGFKSIALCVAFFTIPALGYPVKRSLPGAGSFAGGDDSCGGDGWSVVIPLLPIKE
jgi:hypothetical protein